MQKTLISAVKPTGTVHIGNYFGAMRQFVDRQDDYRQFIFVANYHALTLLQKLTLDLVMDYLAIGVDPKKTTIFLQSDVPEVTELAWIFNTITTVPYLMRAHAYKDAEAKNHEVNVGLFDYPILMAADILIYGADVVPVGQDQKQHIEIARDTAQKFNHTFGETFKLPEPIIFENVKTAMSLASLRVMRKSEKQ
jgi:tryptophanyl-tRNA synthetase